MPTMEDIKDREKEICKGLGIAYINTDYDPEEELYKAEKMMQKYELEQIEKAQQAFYKLKPSTKKARRLEHRKNLLKLKYQRLNYDDSDLPF